MSKITIVDRTTVKEIGDRVEVEWKLSGEPAVEWAEIFQIRRCVGPGGPRGLDEGWRS